jgi:hypothetical protein
VLPGVAASLKHLPDIANGGETATTHTISNEVAAFLFATQGRYSYPVVEDQLAGFGQRYGIILGGDHAGGAFFVARIARSISA